MKKFALAAVLTAAMLAIAVPEAAIASYLPTDMQERVDAILDANPGGTQIAWNEVSWDKGSVIVTLAQSGGSDDIEPFASVGGCASGSFCAYDQTGYKGDKITYSSCTSDHSLAALPGAVRSVANSRAAGTVRVYAGTTLLATAAPGTGTNVTGTTTKLSCS